MKTPLEILADIRIPLPCSASWNAMAGDERARHCALCNQTVHDLSRMTAAQAAELLTTTNWNACIRFSRTADGTIRTADKPVRRWRRLAALAASWLGLVSAAGCDPQGKPCMPLMTAKQPLPPEAGCDIGGVQTSPRPGPRP